MISLAPRTRREIRTLRVHLLIAFISLLYSINSYAQINPCYKPMVGSAMSARVIQNGVLQVNSGLFSPLSSITDANTTNYASNTGVLGALGATGVSVLSSQTFPSGWRAGFVVELVGGTLAANVLNGITLKTLFNGTEVDSKTTATGLQVTLLGGSSSGKLFLNFASTGAFNEVQFLLNSGITVSINELRVYYAMAFDPLCGNNETNTICEDQIAGLGTVVNYNAGLLNVLGSLANPNNIIDGNKNTSAQLTLPAKTETLSPPVYVGVTDMFNVYPSGNKAGFVIKANSELLSSTVLNTIKIQTYLFGDLVGEASFADGSGLLALNALSFGITDRKKLEFTSPGRFNEVRIVFGSGIDVSTSVLDIYYAYESGPTCADCRQLLSSDSPPSPFTGSIVTGNDFTGCSTALGTVSCLWTGQFGLLTNLSSVSNPGNAITLDQTDYAVVNAVGALGAGARLTVATAGLQPANSFAGFEISGNNTGILGLLDLSVLGNITIRAFNGTAQVDSKTGVDLLDVGVLAGTNGKTVVGFRPIATYNRLVFEVGSGLVGAVPYRVYNAFVILDTDSDGTPDCIDQCAGADDSIDSDGDGTPNACDAGTPDLTPQIFSPGSTYVRGDSRDVVIAINNAGAQPTSGPVVFEFTKIAPVFTMVVTPTATTSEVTNHTAVNNGEWTFLEQFSRYVVTLNDGLTIPAGGVKKIVVRVTASGSTKGVATITATVNPNAGGEPTSAARNNKYFYRISID